MNIELNDEEIVVLKEALAIYYGDILADVKKLGFMDTEWKRKQLVKSLDVANMFNKLNEL